MSSQFESKRFEIEVKIRKKRMKGFGLVSLSIVILLVCLFDLFIGYLAGYLPINQDIVEAVLFLAASTAGLYGIGWIFDPINPQEHAFYEIVEALILLEKGGESESVNQIARKRVLNASKKLNYLRGGRASWTSDTRKIENLFIRNLRTRIAPAILDGKSVTSYLIDIAWTLLRQDISLLNRINDRLENDLGKEEEKEIAPPLRSRIFSFLFGLQERTIGKAIISIIGGFGFVVLLTWIGMRSSPEFTIQVKENLIQIFSCGIVLSAGLMGLLTERLGTTRAVKEVLIEMIKFENVNERAQIVGENGEIVPRLVDSRRKKNDA